MKKKFISILVIISTLFLTIGCKKNSVKPYNSYIEAFNTSIVLTMYDKKELKKVSPDFADYMDKIYHLLDKEKLYDNFTNVATINKSYGKNTPIAVDELLFEALKESIMLTKLTDGYFNLTAGALSDVWTYYNNDGVEDVRFTTIGTIKEDPDTEMINAALSCTVKVNDLDTVIVLNEEDHSVTFNKYSDCPNNLPVVITLGAYGKGFAIEKGKAYMATLTDKPYIINAGNSSILASGTNPLKSRNTWNASIQAPYPFSASTACGVINNVYGIILGIEGDMTISTSGDTEKFYFTNRNDCEGGHTDCRVIDEYGIPVKRHHIINPNTGYPDNYWNIVTVTSTSRADVLDALTTALYGQENIQKVEEMISKMENHYNMTIDYVLQRAKLDNNQEAYSDTYMSESLKTKLIKTEDYIKVHN